MRLCRMCRLENLHQCAEKSRSTEPPPCTPPGYRWRERNGAARCISACGGRCRLENLHHKISAWGRSQPSRLCHMKRNPEGLRSGGGKGVAGRGVHCAEVGV